MPVASQGGTRRKRMDSAPAGRIDAYRQRTATLFGRLVCGGGGDSCER
ncbi:hypothetical protein [Pseudomonas sp. TUM22785]|nr:hypothetical protein [Pseudomonas sp. TUM22785]WCD83428.1 hypothetical protein PI990_15785 [Pseudomonas sp. TUM22785]